jgi:hypothetical protein
MKIVHMAIASLALAGLACAQDVKYNFDQKADFTKYKTYTWQKHPNSSDLDELTMKQLAAAFDAELTKKGLTRTEGASDLVIVYQLAFGTEKQITSFNSGYGYGPGWGGGWYGGMGTSMSTATTSTITIGSLDLDMYDAKSKTLVWRCLASKQLNPKSDPAKREKPMRKAAQKILKNYPPKVKK